MDNVIAAVLGFALLAAFVGGLAISIGAVPFFVIAVLVLGMALVDVVQSILSGRK